MLTCSPQPRTPDGGSADDEPSSATGDTGPRSPGSDDFSFEELIAWLASWAARIGEALLEKALIAYYVARDPRTPSWAQGTLIGALVYLGLPVDVVPDFVPFVGFGDDAMVLALALAAVVTCVRVRHIRQARRTMRSWDIDVADPDPDLDDDAATSSD